jgi:AraC family transcriptional regulator, transcriptional activator of pobA
VTTGNTIEFVDLVDAELADAPLAFAFHHLEGTTFQASATRSPHRHNYQEIIVVLKGHGLHLIDDRPFELVAPSVSLVGQGQVHLFQEATAITGWVLRFTDDFLPAGQVSQDWNYHATLFNQFVTTRTLAIPAAELPTLTTTIALIEAEWNHATGMFRESALRHLLSVLLIRLERIARAAMVGDSHDREAYHIYQQFVGLLEARYTHHHDVVYYADTLRLTPARLSRVLGRLVGKTTKQLIDERVVLEAKRYLQYTDRSIKDIAVALGYSDMFHLSKVFKRVTGSAPQVFRDKRRKMT